MMTGLARLDDKIEPEPMSGCWIWIGAWHSEGYGVQSGRFAHRLMYERATGVPVPSGMTIDHLCRVRACVNPAHLEVVPRVVNIMRGAGRNGALYVPPTHCNRGHSLADTPRNNQGRCRECRRVTGQ